MNNYKQDSRNMLWPGLLLVGLGLIASSVVATQFLAIRWGFHPALSGQLTGQFYYPWQWIVWTLEYHDQYPTLIGTALFIVAGGVILSFLAYILLFIFFGRRMKAHETMHGSARWAKKEDVVRSGLLTKKTNDNKGVYVGGFEPASRGKSKVQYLRHNGPEHVLVFAPTRSGKGVGLILPTLLSWMHSCVILDLKGENWALTSGWRKKHAKNKVLRFDPSASEGSVRFNPLAEVRLGDQEVADVQNIAAMIVDPDGKGMNDHWSKTAFALLTGMILHVLYKAQREACSATLLDVSDTISDPNNPIDEVLEDLLEYPHKEGAVHPVVANSARDVLNMSEKERSSVISTAVSYLTLYRDPIVAKNTAASDFAIRDLMNHESPVSLYLVIRPNDLDRLRPLVRLLLNQILRTLVERMEFAEGRSVKHYKHRLLLMLDEFPALGKLEIFEQSLAFIAGYGIKAYLITQDLTQLQKSYGREESIMSNCHVRVAYSPNKVETAEVLSKLCGTTTVVKKSVSRSGKRFGATLGSVSESIQEVQRPLLTPDECMQLPGPKLDQQDQIIEAGNMLIFVAGYPAIYGRQILYFTDPAFSARSMVPPPIETDRLIESSEALSNDEADFNLASSASVAKLPMRGLEQEGSVDLDNEEETTLLAPVTDEPVGDQGGEDDVLPESDFRL